MIYLFLYHCLTYISSLQEVKISKFRELSASVRVAINDGVYDNFMCEGVYLKIHGSFIQDYRSDMACLPKLLRLDINFNDFMYNDKMFEPLAEIYIDVCEPGGTYIIFFSGILLVKPNTKRIISKDSQIHKGDVTIHYRCQGYSGANCHIEDIPNMNFYSHHIYKHILCKDQTGVNCGDQECFLGKNCGNGKCYVETFSQQEYCVCNENYYGNSCEHQFKKIELTEDLLIFTPQNELENVYTISDCKYCHECKKYEKYEVCTRFKPHLKVNQCIGNCEETCGSDICRMKIDNSIYYYEISLKETN